MEFTSGRMATTVTAAAAVALVSGLLVLGATSASAGGGAVPPGSPQPSHGGGAVDRDGRPVPAKMYVGDTPPSDLGTLQESGSVTADPEPVSGAFR